MILFYRCRIILLHMINEEIENQEVIVDTEEVIVDTEEEINTDCFQIEDFEEDLEDYLPQIDHLFDE